MITIVAAGIAAIAVLIGYWVTYRTSRKDSKAETYAKALAAVTAYQHLPYRIRRRTGDDAETRRKLGELTSDIHQELNYYRYLLKLDSELVDSAYDDLIRAVYENGARHRDDAWGRPPISSDSGMTKLGTYEPGGWKQLHDCINAMRQELGKSPLRPDQYSNARLTAGVAE